jgi:hypothetical protein
MPAREAGKEWTAEVTEWPANKIQDLRERKGRLEWERE